MKGQSVNADVWKYHTLSAVGDYLPKLCQGMDFGGATIKEKSTHILNRIYIAYFM